MAERSTFCTSFALATILCMRGVLAEAPTPLPTVEPEVEISENLASAIDQQPTSEGIRLDEALTPVASYLQSGGAGPGGAGPGGAAKAKYPVINISGAAQVDGIWFH